jgi:hypothetical protein
MKRPFTKKKITLVFLHIITVSLVLGIPAHINHHLMEDADFRSATLFVSNPNLDGFGLDKKTFFHPRTITRHFVMPVPSFIEFFLPSFPQSSALDRKNLTLLC